MGLAVVLSQRERLLNVGEQGFFATVEVLSPSTLGVLEPRELDEQIFRPAFDPEGPIVKATQHATIDKLERHWRACATVASCVATLDL